MQDVLYVRSRRRENPALSPSYAVQGYCPECDSGRASPTRAVLRHSRSVQAIRRRTTGNGNARRDADLADILAAGATAVWLHDAMNNGGIPDHGLPALVDHVQSPPATCSCTTAQSHQSAAECSSWAVRESVLGAFQQYLRNQNLFSFWNPQRDTLAPHVQQQQLPSQGDHDGELASFRNLDVVIGSRASRRTLDEAWRGWQIPGRLCRQSELEQELRTVADEI